MSCGMTKSQLTVSIKHHFWREESQSWSNQSNSAYPYSAFSLGQTGSLNEGLNPVFVYSVSSEPWTLCINQHTKCGHFVCWFISIRWNVLWQNCIASIKFQVPGFEPSEMAVSCLLKYWTWSPDFHTDFTIIRVVFNKVKVRGFNSLKYVLSNTHLLNCWTFCRLKILVKNLF